MESKKSTATNSEKSKPMKIEDEKKPRYESESDDDELGEIFSKLDIAKEGDQFFSISEAEAADKEKKDASSKFFLNGKIPPKIIRRPEFLMEEVEEENPVKKRSSDFPNPVGEFSFSAIEASPVAKKANNKGGTSNER